MKRTIQLIGLFTLIAFSFFYTEKAITVVKEQDPITEELKKVENKYKIDPINAIIDNDTIIPGLNGRKIDLDKSYNNMKQIGKFMTNQIEYKEVLPKVSIDNNKNKYIVKGNSTKQMVSIIFIIKDDTNIDKLENILLNKDIYVNHFVDYTYLVNNSTKIKNMTNAEIYSYGINGKYTPDNLLFSNNLISRITNNEAKYCLVTEKNEKNLSLCSSYGLYTIYPTIIPNKDAYTEISLNLNSGSLILLNLDSKTLNELELIIDYIEGKGLKIDTLSSMLSEKNEKLSS